MVHEPRSVVDAGAKTFASPPPSAAPEGGSSQPGAELAAGATHGALLERGPDGERYELRGVLGVGGMGEVRLVHDHRVGREVAVKVMRSEAASDPSMVARFVREARIQGQLEHPMLVPVHELAVDERGTVFFSMKRVRGLTLQEVLSRRAAGDPEVLQRFSLRRLLTAFCSVCLAIDFAHGHGVVHRDVKPSNLMLGEHGEVHVLDWGVARVLPSAVPSLQDDGAPRSGGTEGSRGANGVQGAIVGTPGYMAPEQLAGDTDGVGPLADVYALGAMLFEILAGERLHQGKDVLALLGSNLRGADARVSVRVPGSDVPPELEAACVSATARRPQDRPASARALCELVERYLEGDRDFERRRALADEHADRARETASQVSSPGEGGRSARSAALREVVTALALDPEHAPARRTLVQLLVTPPAEVPPEVAREIDAAEQQERKRGARLALFSNAVWAAFVPVSLLMGVRNWLFAGVIVALIAASVAASSLCLAVDRIERRHVFLVLGCNCAAIGAFSTLFGPFFFVPTVAGANLVFFSLLGGLRGHRVLLSALGAAASVVPWFLEATGVLASSLRFTEEGIVIRAQMLDFPAGLTTAFLLFSTLAIVPVVIYEADKLRSALAEAELLNRLQSWQLRQMVPDEPPASSARGPRSLPRPSSRGAGPPEPPGPPAPGSGDGARTGTATLDPL
jgi:eukaryotic-like serine/threonine-protein kinase